jgi:hypothetical protein
MGTCLMFDLFELGVLSDGEREKQASKPTTPLWTLAVWKIGVVWGCMYV